MARVVGHGAAVSISPQTLWSFANGRHDVTITAGRVDAQDHVTLHACSLAVRLEGGPSQPTTLAASSRYGVRSLSFRLPPGLRLAAGPDRRLGSVSIATAGVPGRGFILVGPRTEWNAVTVTIGPHAVTVGNLPPRTGVVSITFGPGVVSGQPGIVTLTARERGSGARLGAWTPATWLP